MAITIIGYRGSGKTSIAESLSKKLKWVSVDSDDIIEESEERDICDIFDEDGEEYFRAIEKEVMKKLLKQDKLLIAAGGGVILDEDTRALMKKSGPVIWLQATVEDLSKRIAGDLLTDTRRPALTPLGVQEEIADVLKEREPLYRDSASLIIDTTEKTPEEIATEAYELLQK